ncbi:chitinase [Colletotrichum asianum]|uniref:chitinase n=1 Tax=Colletotrichum asianum TaxID=702518 RepID=A0A8H3WCY0_9PEZI|nr:chitinase [Colletotrichum asianum]
MKPFIFLTFAALGLALPSDIIRNATDGVAEPTSSAVPSKPVLIPDDSVVNNSTERKLNLGVKAISPASDVQTNTPWSTPLIDDCPKLCSVVGPDPSNWTRVQHEDDLVRCKVPLLFDFNFHITGSVKTFRTCAFEAPQSTSTVRRYVPVEARQNNESISTFSSDNGPKVCGASESTLQLLVSTSPTGVISSGADAAAAAAKMLGSHLAETASCGRTILFARVDTAIVALYVSADVVTTSVATLVIDTFATSVQQGSELVQSCDTNSLNPYTIGLFAVNGLDQLGRAQRAMQTWSSGGCVRDHTNSSKSFEGVGVLGASDLVVLPSNYTSNSTTKRGVSNLTPRAVCTAIEVEKDDGCASLASRCGIRGADFLKYNTKTNLCANLIPGQLVCCSSGTLPDNTPQPQPNGICATHSISLGDLCWSIADTYGISETDLEKYNANSWGWAGCNSLKQDQIICISKGNTPMPVQLPDVACGPQKLGTQMPSGTYDGWDLAKLNQCPLKSCCSGWGYCGTTAEFCTESPADTGAPGAFKKDTNGCISNCGMEITNNKSPPTEFRRIGYFQAYNEARGCLTMDASQIMDIYDTYPLTHIHFAFAGLTPDLDVKIADNVKDQFEKFVSMDAPFKKIISFGGWAESTDPATYQLYRDAVSPTNRERVASNVLRFLDANPGLDGVDFDWEYPGADDQGIPGSDPVDAIYYSRFLSLMRDKLGKNGRSLSIAIPASYWYLKPFPVEDMAKVLDYFIYMTYDLHGQWDYGNKYANPGCENGNCLRSHVNITETTNSLVMLTKAGVSADKIIVGVTSYGRSFRMADKSCTGRNCLFTGSRTVSDAEPGICTDTGGYISNAELDQIFTFAEEGEPGYEAKRWHDGPTNSDIMTYGTQGNGMTDWVAYMSDTTKSTRSDWIKGLNFGGTTDWAIDLLNFLGAPEGQEGGFTVDGGENLECNSETWPTNLDDLEKNIDNVPPHCRSMALLNVLIRDLEKVIAEYRDVASSSDYDDRFWWYADWVKDSIDERLEEFLKIGTGEGLKYMDCEWSSKGNSGEGPCTEAHLSYPPGPSPGPRTVTFTMRDETGFYDALASKAGIQREWITWRDMDAINDPCVCPPTQPGICPVDCTMNYYMRKNWPKRVSDKDKIEIENPKSIIEEAIPSTDVLVGTIVGTYIEMRMGVLDADEADVLTAFSMPLLMMQDASNSIKEIKEIGKEQKETKTRELVLGILSIVFAVIPFAGQAASALGGAARLATMALIIGEAGNAAISIVDIVKDPNSAPFAILGMLVGAAGMRGGKPPREAFAEAGKARRALTPKMMESFSPEFRRKDGLVQNVVKTCKVR